MPQITCRKWEKEDSTRHQKFGSRQLKNSIATSWAWEDAQRSSFDGEYQKTHFRYVRFKVSGWRHEWTVRYTCLESGQKSRLEKALETRACRRYLKPKTECTHQERAPGWDRRSSRLSPNSLLMKFTQETWKNPKGGLDRRHQHH